MYTELCCSAGARCDALAATPVWVRYAAQQDALSDLSRPVELSSCSPPHSLMLTQPPRGLRFLDEPHFKDRHFHGQVRRIARDTPDRLRPLSRLLLGPALAGQWQLLPRVPLRQSLCLPRSRTAFRSHPGLAAGVHAAPTCVLRAAPPRRHVFFMVAARYGPPPFRPGAPSDAPQPRKAPS